MDVQAYLERINYHGDLTPTIEILRQLHLAHLLSVPFENLNIHVGRPIVLDEAALFDKIVKQRRGGFCYELNGLFARLLRQLGYDVTLLSANVMNSQGEPGAEFDHMTLMVRLDSVEWLVDVGFGMSFLQPIRLDGSMTEYDPDYRVSQEVEYLFLQGRNAEEEWRSQYRFTLQPRDFADYEPMCHFHQTSPESHFTQKRVCTLATPDGRITLSDMRWIETVNSVRHERIVESQDEYTALLRDKFGIVL